MIGNFKRIIIFVIIIFTAVRVMSVKIFKIFFHLTLTRGNCAEKCAEMDRNGKHIIVSNISVLNPQTSNYSVIKSNHYFIYLSA